MFSRVILKNIPQDIISLYRSVERNFRKSVKLDADIIYLIEGIVTGYFKCGVTLFCQPRLSY